MPDVWDTEIYRARAEAWRHKAGEFPEGSPTRRHCLAIAEGYARLADLIEASGRTREAKESEPRP
jgi:hypothetical protein